MLTDFNDEADYYDLLEKRNVGLHKKVNDYLINLFRNYNINEVIDFSCGTGAQAIPLSDAGFIVTAIDISERMLQKAMEKCHKQNISFRIGDMRSTECGKFDAAITILNTIGYLTKDEFSQSLKNIHNNLSGNGFYIFDNTNRQALENGMLNRERFLDIAMEYDGNKIVRFVKSDYDKLSGIAKWDWEVYIQRENSPMHIETGSWVRQTYTLTELESVLKQNNFKIAEVLDRNIKTFSENDSFSYLIVAKKE